MSKIYLIKNATVVSVDSDIGTVPNCSVLIEGQDIKAVGPNVQPPQDAVIIDGTDTILTPGFVDTHRHTWQIQLRTVTSDWSLYDYFVHIRNNYGSCYRPEDVYLGNYCGALESLDNGITCLVDHCHILNSPEHSDAAVRGLLDSHIRGAFCYGLYQYAKYSWSEDGIISDAPEPDWRLDDARRIRVRLFRRGNAKTDLLRFGFAPAEIERSTLDQSIKEIEFGRSLGAAIITAHISMGKYDRKYHLVRNLYQRGLLKSDLLLSHGASLQDDELAAMKETGASVSSTPDTELQMGMGQPVAFKARKHGCCASIGVDIVSNNPADMFQQMRQLLQAQRHRDNEAGEGPPMQVSQTCLDVLTLATMGGAEAMGLKDVVGSITPGKKADLLITKCTSTRMTPVHDPVAALVLYANASDIDTVFVNGRIVKEKGQLAGIEWPEVRKRLVKSSEDIMRRARTTVYDKTNGWQN